jgi:glycosyltransferase involved in cell wall biosynthesis
VSFDHRSPDNGVKIDGLSLIICTFNHLDLLKKITRSIFPQKPTDFDYEVIIVDNNSCDGTSKYARDLCATDSRFSYVFEPRQGLSWARNAGAAASKFNFLVYLDDDAWLPENYIAIISEVVARERPDILGAPILPDFVDPVPEWFPVELETRRKKKKSGFYVDVTISGGNFGIKKNILSQLGGFNPRYGMRGLKVGMLEERLMIELYRRIIPPEHQRVYYAVEAFVYHLTPARRMRLQFQLHRGFIANFQLMTFFLSTGVRRKSALRAVCNKRLKESVKKIVPQLKEIVIKKRVASPQLAMAVLSITLRLADCFACYKHLILSCLKIGNAGKNRPTEARVPRICILTSHRQEVLGDGVSGFAPNSLVAELAGLVNAEVLHLGGLTKHAIRQALSTVNLRALDAVVVTDDFLARAIVLLKGDYPHLQMLCVYENSGDVNTAKNLSISKNDDRPRFPMPLSTLWRYGKFFDQVIVIGGRTSVATRFAFGLSSRWCVDFYPSESLDRYSFARGLANTVLQYAPLRQVTFANGGPEP